MHFDSGSTPAVVLIVIHSRFVLSRRRVTEHTTFLGYALDEPNTDGGVTGVHVADVVLKFFERLVPIYDESQRFAQGSIRIPQAGKFGRSSWRQRIGQ